MTIKVRECNPSCQHYLAIPNKKEGVCCYDDHFAVSLRDSCKYGFATERSIRSVQSPEERLLRDTFGVRQDLTVKEILEIKAQSSTQNS